MTLPNHLKNLPQQARSIHTYIKGIIGLTLLTLTISCAQVTELDTLN